MLTTLPPTACCCHAARLGRARSPRGRRSRSRSTAPPREHDAIRRPTGRLRAHRRATSRRSAPPACPFGFIFTLTQHNVDSLEFVVRLAAAEGARSVQVHPLTLEGPRRDDDAPAPRPTDRAGRRLLEAARAAAASRRRRARRRRHAATSSLPHRDRSSRAAGRDAHRRRPDARRRTPTARVGAAHARRRAPPAARLAGEDARLGDARRATGSPPAAATGSRTPAPTPGTSSRDAVPAAAVYWYDEVAARTQRVAAPGRGLPLAPRTPALSRCPAPLHQLTEAFKGSERTTWPGQDTPRERRIRRPASPTRCTGACLRLDPEYRRRRREIELETREFIARYAAEGLRTGIVRIPVVVHVVWNTAAQNISDAQIQSQIDVLNDDFRRLNADAGRRPRRIRRRGRRRAPRVRARRARPELRRDDRHHPHQHRDRPGWTFATPTT